MFEGLAQLLLVAVLTWAAFIGFTGFSIYAFVTGRTGRGLGLAVVPTLLLIRLAWVLWNEEEEEKVWRTRLGVSLLMLPLLIWQGLIWRGPPRTQRATKQPATKPEE